MLFIYLFESRRLTYLEFHQFMHFVLISYFLQFSHGCRATGKHCLRYRGHRGDAAVQGDQLIQVSHSLVS